MTDLGRALPLGTIAKHYGIRSGAQLSRDVRTVLAHLPKRDRFRIGLSTAGMFRPDLALPAYRGVFPRDGVAPIFNLFDRVGGGRGYHNSVTRDRARDFRGGRLTYDEHDGTDLVCPRGTPVACAAPGVLVAVRDSWLRGGLTACVDHGDGVVTQYTHLSEIAASIGQPLVRGEVVAYSGTTGLDMLIGAPWIPPHVHFMVWVSGEPVDPYLAPGDAPRPGTWHGGAPLAAEGPLEGDAHPERLESCVDAAALERIVARCLDASIRDEIEHAPSAAARVAICEDSLHHQPDAWPADLRGTALRTRGDPTRVRITLPLPASAYRTARPADAPWTRP